MFFLHDFGDLLNGKIHEAEHQDFLEPLGAFIIVEPVSCPGIILRRKKFLFVIKSDGAGGNAQFFCEFTCGISHICLLAAPTGA